MSKSCIQLVSLCLLLASSLHSAQAASFKFHSKFAETKWSATITGSLTYPKGSGPFPVVVFLHPCGGITPGVLKALNAHARFMNRNGFAALVLDSFGPRRLAGGKVCGGGALSDTGIDLVIEDAFNAIVALRRVRRIDADNTFLAGQSLGGIAAAWAATRTHRQRNNLFRAVTAWYPRCNAMTGGTKLRSPLLVLAGGKDDWTPPDQCRQAKAQGWVTGADFDVIVYPDALHGFDQPSKTRTYRGYTLGYNARATANGRDRMLEFFKRHLKAKP